MTTEHLPECPAKEPWYTDMDSYYCCSECNPGVTPPWEWACICNALRACEERVLKEALQDAKARESNGITWAQAYSAALDAAREAVVPENLRSAYLVSLSPQEQRIAISALELAAKAIDALRNPPSLPPTKGRAHKY